MITRHVFLGLFAAMTLLGATAREAHALDITIGGAACTRWASNNTTVGCPLTRSTVQSSVSRLMLYYIPNSSVPMSCTATATAPNGVVTRAVTRSGAGGTAIRSISFDTVAGGSGTFYQIICSGVGTGWRFTGITYTE